MTMLAAPDLASPDLASLDPAIALALECAACLAMVEAGEGGDIGRVIGLSAVEIDRLAAYLPAGLAAGLSGHASGWNGPLDEDEAALRRLLLAESALSEDLAALLSGILSRRAMQEDHLWQDLGLPDRTALSALIRAAFPRLHAANDRNMRWKRFFYRRLCEAEGFGLCAVPNCRDCAEFDHCFGDEDGESALSRRLSGREEARTALAVWSKSRSS